MTTSYQDAPYLFAMYAELESYEDDPYLSAMYAELESIWDPFAQHLEKLEDAINQSEREGICSEEVAQAAREEIQACMEEVDLVLFIKTWILHEKLRAAEIISAPLAREQPRLKLNERGYSLAAS
jgi:hypothetical protein